MAEWTTPKTDWFGETVDGIYSGDYFNASDYNRIKNNLNYLYELAQKLYSSFTITSMGNDKTYSDFFYTDDINNIENNLYTLYLKTLKKTIAKTIYYYDSKTPDYTELNRIESLTLDLYNKLTAQYEGRRTLEFNFGSKGGF